MTDKLEQQGVKWIRSDELVKSPSGLLILHNDEPYRLRITRKGKLILTK
ncbi:MULTISPECIES: hemin uptake protein HemP [Marinobacterium]|uniref:Hemin uptake protein hemP n=1 Tax=Marinobacterium iners DSM 11526 TaxID=1122198 RepID=A0A1H3XXJ4_9GAMM|nr:hemin uptake protein HemP [Marinobacterium iners]SEA04187.1 Hemin uptake protein hemP [Marinobacterium iners DSM 11526]